MRFAPFAGLLLCCWGVAAVAADAQLSAEHLTKQYPEAAVSRDACGNATSVAGVPLGYGRTVHESAATFVTTHAQAFGASPDDVVPGNLFNGQLDQPVMWDDEARAYKFTLVYYHQERDGVPVYDSDLRLLVRNDADHALVLARASVRDLGAYRVPAGAARAVAEPAAIHAALSRVPTLTKFEPSRVVIWAGTPESPAEPVLAIQFDAGNSNTREKPEAWRFVADASTGEILYAESLIAFADVSGSVKGLATLSPRAQECLDEVPMPMPYVKVTSGAASVFTDANGLFTLTGVDGTASIVSLITGQWFTLYNAAGAVETLTQSGATGAVNFLHNAANADDLVRAQVNAYVHANVVRDFVLKYNPSYPLGDAAMDIQMNRSDVYCPGNAWFEPLSRSLNLCQGGTRDGITFYTNTALSTVIYHEFGHHVVNVAGSGQGFYGEGAGDSLSALVADDPNLAGGFYLNACETPLRTAVNTQQYPCSTGDVHDCAELLSGAVWDTRTALAASYPAEYRDIVGRLWVNSILLRTRSDISIGNDIPLAFLILDDTDGYIGNGTPHYYEIAAGFGAHGFSFPPLEKGIKVSPTSPLVTYAPPGGPFDPNAWTISVTNIGAWPVDYAVTADVPWLSIEPATGTLAVNGAAAVGVTVNAAANNLPYGAYAATIHFADLTNHVGDTDVSVTLCVSDSAYRWDFDVNPGWTTTGGWAFGAPQGGSGDHGAPDPISGYSGANVYGYRIFSGGGGGYTNALGEQYLTTPALNLSGYRHVRLRFQRWLGVEGPYDQACLRISTNGSAWTDIWCNGGALVDDGAWIPQSIDLSAYADGRPTVYLRWVMGPTDSSITYCGWNLDDVQVWGTRYCGGDANCDRVVNWHDIDFFVTGMNDNESRWRARFAGGAPCDYANLDLNNDGHVNWHDIDPFVRSLNTTCP